MARAFTTGFQSGDHDPLTGFDHRLEQITASDDPFQAGVHHQKCRDVMSEHLRSGVDQIFVLSDGHYIVRHDVRQRDSGETLLRLW